MLVISYGIPKSGSTLAYELIRGMLINAGFSQDIVHADVRANAPPKRGGKRNFVSKMTRENIERLVDAVGPERRIAIKTHDSFEPEMFAWLEKLQAERALQVVASYRDPRDICLSLLDAAEKARSRETGPKAFSHVRDLDHAADKVKHRLGEFRLWAALKGTERVDYHDLAFDTEKVVERLEAAFGIVVNREQVMRYALKEAFTQRNKAKPRRHESELDEVRKKALRRHFRVFIRNVMEENDQAWFDKYRARMLEA
jgi:hypothetical protein